MHTEYSQMTKFEVSRRLRSLVFRSPSPILPPLPSFRPALSFFFFAVRTLLKRSSIFEGNCKAGRWNERASCFDSRVLYYETCQRKWKGSLGCDSQMVAVISERDRHVLLQVVRKSVSHDGDHLLLQPRRSGRWRG